MAWAPIKSDRHGSWFGGVRVAQQPHARFQAKKYTSIQKLLAIAQNEK